MRNRALGRGLSSLLNEEITPIEIITSSLDLEHRRKQSLHQDTLTVSVQPKCSGPGSKDKNMKRRMNDDCQLYNN